MDLSLSLVSRSKSHISLLFMFLVFSKLILRMLQSILVMQRHLKISPI